jgi:hypothetical protein
MTTDRLLAPHALGELVDDPGVVAAAGSLS